MLSQSSEELDLEACQICEKPQDECECCDKCPKCGGEMDALDASICAGCDSYYGDCNCKSNDKIVRQ